ncbi:MAG: hypothetical protein IH859_03000 [Chloroflexi bacterium]|nr:hypothetical protein [Chloroflexota bacterium]
MKLLVSHEIEGKSEGQLCGLFAHACTELNKSSAGSVDRVNALGSMENIARARMACKNMLPVF